MNVFATLRRNHLLSWDRRSRFLSSRGELPSVTTLLLRRVKGFTALTLIFRYLRVAPTPFPRSKHCKLVYTHLLGWLSGRSVMY